MVRAGGVRSRTRSFDVTTSTAYTPLLLAALLMAAGAAQADTAAPAATPAAPHPTLTFSFEVTPEFYALDKTGSYSKGDLADTALKLGVSKALANNISVGASLSEVLREPSTSGAGSSYTALEVNAAYKWKLNPNFSLSPSVTLGYAFGDQPKINPSDAGANEAYYALGLAADWKISSELTWNVVNLRYRNAFSETWITPKVSSGFTYALSPTASLYGTIGESWKDTGSGSKSDKFALAFGIKAAF